MEKILNSSPLKNIYYIELPATFKRNIEGIEIDSSIKLPIETDSIKNWDSTTLTWESIVSGMLKIIVYDPDHKNIEYFKNFIKSVKPNIVNELIDSGIVKSHNKEYKLAKEIFLAVIGLDPENDSNSLNLAFLYEQQAESLIRANHKEQAQEILENTGNIYSTLLNRENILTSTYFNAGYYYFKVRAFAKAEACFLSFIEFSDDHEKIIKVKELLREYKNNSNDEDQLNKAYRLILEEQEPEAITLLIKYLEFNDTIWNGWFLLGWAYRRISNFNEAKISLERAMKLNTSDSDILNELAICFLELRDFTQCKNMLENALKESPEDIRIISNLGIVQLKLGNTDKAKRFFESALVFDPDDTISKQFLEQIN